MRNEQEHILSAVPSFALPSPPPPAADAQLQADLRARGQAPLVCYHKRVLERERAQNPHQTISGVTAAFWAMVKDEWASLPDASPEKLQAAAESEASCAEAKRRRVNAKLAMSSASQPLPPLTAAADRSAQGALVPTTDLQTTLVVAPLTSVHTLDLAPEPTAEVPLPDVSADILRSINDSKWPVALSRCASNLGSQRSLKQQTRDVRQKFAYVAKGTAENFGQVRYDRPCTGLCDVDNSALLNRMHRYLLVRLEKTLRQLKAPFVLFRVTGEQDAGISFMEKEFWFVTGWSPKVCGYITCRYRLVGFRVLF